MQLDIFDLIQDITNVNLCEICKEPCQNNLCGSERCGDAWVDMVFGWIKPKENMRTLHLTLSKNPFEVMVTGEKKEEFRKGSDWIRSRLYDQLGKEKEYDVIKFTNGYGSDKPYFICEFGGFMECYLDIPKRKYSNGLIVDDIGKGDFIIYCGEIIERGNICR